jgi:hypothetical protein
MSEIFNAVIHAKFRIEEFVEHAHWQDQKIPGSFTIVAAEWDSIPTPFEL